MVSMAISGRGADVESKRKIIYYFGAHTYILAMSLFPSINYHTLSTAICCGENSLVVEICSYSIFGDKYL